MLTQLMRSVHLAPGSGQLLPWRTAAQSQSPPLVADSPAASSSSRCRGRGQQNFCTCQFITDISAQDISTAMAYSRDERIFFENESESEYYS